MAAVNPIFDSTGLINLLPVAGPLVIDDTLPVWSSAAVPLAWVAPPISPLPPSGPLPPLLDPNSPGRGLVRTTEGALWCFLHIVASRSAGVDSKLNIEIYPCFDGEYARITRKPVIEYLLDLVAFTSERYFLYLDIEDVGEGFVIFLRRSGGASAILVNTLTVRRGSVAQGR